MDGQSTLRYVLGRSLLALIGAACLLLVFSSGAFAGLLSPVAGSPFPAGGGSDGVAFSPTGTLMAVPNGGDNTISVFKVNSSTGSLTPAAGNPFVVTGSNPSPDAVAFSPDGSLLAVANVNTSTVSVYRVDETTGALTEVDGSPFGADGQATLSVAFSPSGKFVAVANGATDNDDGNVVIMPVMSTGALGKPISFTSDFFFYPRYVQFDPSGRWLAVADTLESAVVMLAVDPASGALSAPDPLAFTGDYDIESLAFNPSGGLLATSDPGGSRISMAEFDSSSGALAAVPGSPFTVAPDLSGPWHVAFSPNGRLLASDSDTGVAVFNVDASTDAVAPVGGSPFAVTGSASITGGVSFSPDGRLLATVDSGSNHIDVFRVNAASSKETVTATAGTTFSGVVAQDNCAPVGAAATINWGDGSSGTSATVDSSGSVMGTHVYLGAGTYSGSVTVTGGCGTGTLTAQVSVGTLQPSLTCTPTSVIVGQGTTCTATLAGASGAPTGAVQFTSSAGGSFSSGSNCTLSAAGSTASCSVLFTPSSGTASPQTITGSYGGDKAYATASATAQISVSPRPSATSVSCVPSSVVAGQGVVCSASVSDPGGGPPSGPVSFSSSGPGAFGGNGTCVLAGSGASASCSVPYTPSGTSATQTISASYAGGAVWSGSNGSTGLAVKSNQQVTRAGVGVSVGCSPGSVLPAGSVTCAVSVLPAAGSGVPSGTVVLTVSGGAGVSGGGSCVLDGSGRCSVTYNLAASASGTYTVSASYPGDATYLPAAEMTTFAVAAAAGKAASVAVVSGTVLIELASGQYVPLKGSTVSVPVGSTLDTRHGKVTISTAGDYRKPSSRHHKLQNATLSAAIFTIEQRTAAQARARLRKRERLVGIPPTDLLLRTPTGQTTKAGCRRTGTGGTGLVRAITGQGEGLFRTVGADSVTTIRNATWVVEDRCNGTITEVGKGTATVTPTKHADHHQKTVTVHPGQGVIIKGRFL
jgi:6-phosphogluconolactonase